jgi:hypothetical protein
MERLDDEVSEVLMPSHWWPNIDQTAKTYIMARFPKPQCAKCGRPVDRMATSLNQLTGKWTLTVHCHGETETMYFDDADDEREIVEAIAFKGDR